jgi:anti-sigma factor RsiW
VKCEAIQELMLDYVDRKLSAGKSRKITKHISNCEICERIYERHQKTHEALKEFGEAVRTATFDMEVPPMPLIQRHPIWVRIWGSLKTPVPVWIPSATFVAVLLILVTLISSPLELSIEWGREKGGGNIGNVKPPLAAEAMLEFLIMPDLTDPGQLAASIEAVEKFLEAHPEDLAMHAKLIELYQAQLKLKPLSESSRAMLEEKLSLERARFIELLGKTEITKGTENDEK